MVLVDTSVWIFHLREGDPRLRDLLVAAEVLTHDFIVGELACGHLKNRKEILSLLQRLPSAPVVSQKELLYFIEEHSLMGQGLGFIDAHLLASVQMAGVPLWTRDRTLRRSASRLNLSHV